MARRVILVYGFCFVMLTGMVLRLYELSRGELMAQTSLNQSTYTLEVGQTRGGIYDCNFEPLVNESSETVTAVVPSPDTAAWLLPQLIGQEREDMMAMLQQGKPFLYSPTPEIVSGVGVWQFELPKRYTTDQSAVHVIGYLGGSSGQGVSGIEAAYDDILQGYGDDIEVSCQVDAAGRALSGGEIRGQDGTNPLGGVVLSINAGIQEVVEEALTQSGTLKGAAVVMDVHSGDILAMASIPTYDPSDVAASLGSESAPLLNRALSAYSVGSTFKLAVAAAALEQGISATTDYTCEGYVQVDDHTFWCNNRTGHGEIDMTQAVAESCNSYFIQLVQEMDIARLHGMAKQLGFGRSVSLADDLIGAAGVLTPMEELTSGELANFSFGQGKLTATPLQIAGMIATIAGGGEMVSPRLVQGITDDASTIVQAEPMYATQRVMSEQTAAELRHMMIAAVEEGSATMAKPQFGGAGGKTGSAQTGVKVNGEEIVQAWFGGFYPKEDPKWAIVVLCEEGQSGSRVAAPIFADIANGINDLGYESYSAIH